MLRRTGPPLLELIEQARALERAGERLGDAAEEAQVLREVPLPSVVHVEQPEQLVADHQRETDLAGEAVVVVGALLVFVELRVVRARDGEDLVALHRLHRRGVPLEVEDAAEHGEVVSAAVVARHAPEGPVPHAVDVAVRGVHRGQDPFRRGAHELADVARAARKGGQLDELVEEAVAAVHLLEQGGVLQGVRRHLAEAADQVEVLGEVARPVVGEFDHAENVTPHDERHRELRLIAPLLQRVAAVVVEEPARPATRS